MKMLSAKKAKMCSLSVRSALPREGSRIRELHDMFVSNRGIPVSYYNNSSDSYRIEQLRSIYGLDIRSLRNGRWVLAGEWIGSEYIDYIGAVVAGHP